MKTLVKYVDQGGVIEIHDDIPDSLREQLYAEENQRLERRKKSSDNPANGSICPPININVLPAQSQVSMPTPAGTDITLSTPSSHIDSIVIPGCLDIAVNNYTIWHQSRMSSEAFKENIQKARDVALESCLDLKQIFEDQDPGFFVKQGVKVGVARRFVNDISHWVKRHGDEMNDNRSNMLFIIQPIEYSSPGHYWNIQIKCHCYEIDSINYQRHSHGRTKGCTSAQPNQRSA